MAKKQSRRSVSLSRTTYERLRTYCETSGVSMSQFVEGRIGDFLGRAPSAPAVKRPEAASPAPQATASAPIAPRPVPVVAAPAPAPVPVAAPPAPVTPRPAPVAAAPASAPLPVRIAPSAPNPGQKAPPAKPVKLDEAAAKRAADRIFTF
jgi:hypothetical protein